MTRDLDWDAMVTVAERLTTDYGSTRPRGDVLRCDAVRRRSLGRVTEGLRVGNDSTAVFEPVRARRVFSRTWRPIQPIEQAASRIGRLMREPPDRR